MGGLARFGATLYQLARVHPETPCEFHAPRGFCSEGRPFSSWRVQFGAPPFPDCPAPHRKVQGKSLPSFGNSGQVRLPKGGLVRKRTVGTASGHGQIKGSVEIDPAFAAAEGLSGDPGCGSAAHRPENRSRCRYQSCESIKTKIPSDLFQVRGDFIWGMRRRRPTLPRSLPAQYHRRRGA